MKKRKSIKDEPMGQCIECGQMGRIGPDVVITGLGHIVHHGECHMRLWRYLERSTLVALEFEDDEYIEN